MAEHIINTQVKDIADIVFHAHEKKSADKYLTYQEAIERLLSLKESYPIIGDMFLSILQEKLMGTQFNVMSNIEIWCIDEELFNVAKNNFYALDIDLKKLEMTKIESAINFSNPQYRTTHDPFWAWRVSDEQKMFNSICAKEEEFFKELSTNLVHRFILTKDGAGRILDYFCDYIQAVKPYMSQASFDKIEEQINTYFAEFYFYDFDLDVINKFFSTFGCLPGQSTELEHSVCQVRGFSNVSMIASNNNKNLILQSIFLSDTEVIEHICSCLDTICLNAHILNEVDKNLVAKAVLRIQHCPDFSSEPKELQNAPQEMELYNRIKFLINKTFISLNLTTQIDDTSVKNVFKI